MTNQIINRSDRKMERKKADARLGRITNTNLATKWITAVISSHNVRDRLSAAYYPAHITGGSEILLKRAQTYQ